MTKEASNYVWVVIICKLRAGLLACAMYNINTPPQWAPSHGPIPNILQSSLWCGVWSGLVKMSAAFWSDGTNMGWMTCFWTSFLIQWYATLMCFMQLGLWGLNHWTCHQMWVSNLWWCSSTSQFEVWHSNVYDQGWTRTVQWTGWPSRCQDMSWLQHDWVSQWEPGKVLNA